MFNGAAKKKARSKSDEQLTQLFRQLMQELQAAVSLEDTYDLAEELAAACERSCVHALLAGGRADRGCGVAGCKVVGL